MDTMSAKKPWRIWTIGSHGTTKKYTQYWNHNKTKQSKLYVHTKNALMTCMWIGMLAIPFSSQRTWMTGLRVCHPLLIPYHIQFLTRVLSVSHSMELRKAWTISYEKMNLHISPAKHLQLCPSLNVLKVTYQWVCGCVLVATSFSITTISSTLHVIWTYEHAACYPCIVYKLTSRVTLYSYRMILAAFPTANCKLMLGYHELYKIYYYYIRFSCHITGMLWENSEIYLQISSNQDLNQEAPFGKLICSVVRSSDIAYVWRN